MAQATGSHQKLRQLQNEREVHTRGADEEFCVLARPSREVSERVISLTDEELERIEIATFKRIAKTDSKPIGNIILNMGLCKFCKAFEIDDCGSSENFTSCTDYIDDFLKQYYRKG